MTKSDRIRQLAERGLSRTEIASELGVRYQHVYNVLKRSGMLKASKPSRRGEVSTTALEAITPPPPFLISSLVSKGFSHLGEWQLDGADGIRLSNAAPSKSGVYAFAVDGEIVYVGVSERNLRQRLYFYAKPGPRQRTSIRIKALIIEHLRKGQAVSVSIAHPDGAVWNDFALPMDTAVEAGLIRTIRPRWNKMGL